MVSGVLEQVQYFNPLPRKEGDETAKNGQIGSKQISIHSLVKRETNEHPAK